MAAFNKFNIFVADVANGVHNLGSNTLKVYLTNATPVASNTVYNTPLDLSTANGYTNGGYTVTISSSNQSAGIYKLVPTTPQPTWTASAGNIGPFEYAVLYNFTAASKNLIGWWDYGAALTLYPGDTFTVTLDATNGILQLV